MQIDRQKLRRIEAEATAAQAIFEACRDRLSEARRRASFDSAFLLKALSGLHSRKHAHLRGLVADLPELIAQAEESQLPQIARQARQVIELRAEVQALEAESADAERRYHALAATARRCREFAHTVDGIQQPQRPFTISNPAGF